ncbi:hypothetical protein [Aggregatilinea lenta]|uniref:hypothetical protein n=1 Tax=Aggregatilinea lenta TaxID=913108 RepID=UPI000E5BDE74|nr:hypothetical protein [Aggregatilinea lenta]
MTRNQPLHLGSNSTPIQQGRSAHGRWRAAYRRAGADEPVPASFDLYQDADRLVFALAEGPAASVLAPRLAELVWAQEINDDRWPQMIRETLNDVDAWADAPPGLTAFLCGRVERGGRRSRIKLAWLGMAGVHLYDRVHMLLPLDDDLSPGEGWSGQEGIHPQGAALHAYRGELRGVERMAVFSTGAAPLGDDLAELSRVDLEQALDDWAAESTHDLLVFDLQLIPVTSEPRGISLFYYWPSPDVCLLMWRPSVVATGYRIEQSVEPTFESPLLLADLTDGRQVQYGFSPPVGEVAYYRVIPVNSGIDGPPSAPVTVMPISLSPPVMQPVAWSPDGGYTLTWSTIPQADAYEVQTSVQLVFEAEASFILYRGEVPELYLPSSTPPGAYYRVRALNTRYAPQQPSVWSRAERAPSVLPTPVFREVTQDRISWEPVPGARQYEVRFRSSAHLESEWESLLTVEPFSAVAANEPTTYRVRALRNPNELHTASPWCAPITLSPPEVRVNAPGPSLRLALPLMAGVALVALVVGAALGLAGSAAIRDEATVTPNLTATVRSAVSTAVAATLSVPTTPDRTSGLDGLSSDTDTCLASSPAGTVADIHSVAHPDATIIARLDAPLRVLERRILGSGPGDAWLGVWIEDQGRAGWVAAPDVILTPEGCGDLLPTTQ